MVGTCAASLQELFRVVTVYILLRVLEHGLFVGFLAVTLSVIESHCTEKHIVGIICALAVQKGKTLSFPKVLFLRRVRM